MPLNSLNPLYAMKTLKLFLQELNRDRIRRTMARRWAELKTDALSQMLAFCYVALAICIFLYAYLQYQRP